MSAIDYDEVVELWSANEGSDDPPRHGQFMWEGQRSMPLWRAVRTVVVDWAAGSRRQMSAQIIRNQGASLMDLGGIQAIYDRDDFPAKRDRGA